MTTPWNGIPDDPDSVGWHWFAWEGRRPFPLKWHAEDQRWETIDDVFRRPDEMLDFAPYLGPCLTPKQVTSVRAEERAAAWNEVERISTLRLRLVSDLIRMLDLGGNGDAEVNLSSVLKRGDIDAHSHHTLSRVVGQLMNVRARLINE